MERSSYKASDFKDVKYNVLDIGEQKVLEAFPDLKKYPEFNLNYEVFTGLNNDKILKYMMLVYTDNILNRTIPELLKQKREAALLAGFEIGLKTRRFPEKLERVFECKHWDLNKLLVRICRLNNNSSFEQLAIYEEARARQMVKLVSDTIDNEKIKDIHENIRRLTIDIDSLERDLLAGEKDKEIIDMLYHEIENIQLGIRPEEIAEAKRQGALDLVLLDVYKEHVDESKIHDIRPQRKRGRPKKVKADEKAGS